MGKGNSVLLQENLASAKLKELLLKKKIKAWFEFPGFQPAAFFILPENSLGLFL